MEQGTNSTAQPKRVTIRIKRRGLTVSKEGKGDEVYQGEDVNLISHAAVVIGLGTNGEGIDYWLCRNSYGPTRIWESY
ncbi:hypothetical protein RJ640_006786 [Escallonia rubra]|uniref:Peptidase C1A papain C-terminal domain-containing protein n=1 Tax=Escallonia rubra TaxID=112253 RepID=A0AA88UEN7_9ASTE|nr:hypothetical protein RJ640_006786 [Escallonia rubra]